MNFDSLVEKFIDASVTYESDLALFFIVLRNSSINLLRNSQICHLRRKSIVLLVLPSFCLVKVTKKLRELADYDTNCDSANQNKETCQ